jgi:hypothetical protein
MVKDAMRPAVGPSHIAVETKGVCALLQWALQMAMEAIPSLARVSLDAINAYGEIERECIEAALKANPFLHRLLPLLELLYKKGEGVLWYYDEDGNFVMGAKQRREVRHGCVMGMFLFCLTMEPVYAALRTTVGEEGVLYNYCDDSYMLALVDNMVEVFHQAPAIFGKVGRRLGYGQGKTKLIPPQVVQEKSSPSP